MSRQPGDLRPGRPERPRTPGAPPEQNWRWVGIVLFALVLAALVFSRFPGTQTKSQLTYNELIQKVQAGQVASATVNNDNGKITGELSDKDHTRFSVTGPHPMPDSVEELMRQKVPKLQFTNTTPSLLGALLPFLFPVAILIGFWVWMSRRAQGQMTGLMSIGRSKAKVYTTERPKTTFNDVAGYTGVKQEIREVVDFLKMPGKFREVGARIPKGVLLVGPPGTGKTLLARAVAGEAGVPFISVTGSDFMEMFVGVGAARVRDLFQTARKQAPAIIFVDEIDSIGRKRGAGLGGGHDEREQTLNQMLAEMDGFETTEGIVMMAATNRPDILDPALLRPGRFDRQIVVPLPDLEERLPILKVHCKDKRLGPDVDLEIVARGTPGMSGADLANLVNEAALHAVRRGGDAVHMQDFEAARDRVTMGQRRESIALSEKEKELTAFHEGGHAVLAYVLPNADPVHKVTILPTGMALGVTQQLPMAERHTYDLGYIQDTLAVRMGGRVAELLIFGTLTTGASNDLQGSTELARKMVREFGMSEKIGPMAWGSQGMVFLGEDLMHTRDYSDGTQQVIDEEVERILREQEERAMTVLKRHRKGLEAVARALLDQETIDGAEVGRLVDQAYGKAVHAPGVKSIPRFGTTEPTDAGPLNGDPEPTEVMER
ncbi:MAG TPA: ATP-dependent zinc metalloprotease FtsH [Acidimicrobiales bacterium]|nr:ATP-dependent zinc metalloprotease FtsH [Acidimicrobiales bacterium]